MIGPGGDFGQVKPVDHRILVGEHHKYDAVTTPERDGMHTAAATAMGVNRQIIVEIGNFSHHKALLAELGVPMKEIDSLIFKHSVGS